MTERREIIKRLPAVHQSETLQRFFSATVDHLFQPQASEQLSGYVGRRPLYVNPEEDFYVPEPTDTRAAYSLEPLAISTDAAGTLRNALFYEDLFNALRFAGGKIDEHNRLFETEYYSWAPAVDLDMLNNPRSYYWVPQGPDPITLVSRTNVEQDIVGSRTLPLVYTGLYYLPDDDLTGTPRDGASEPLTLSSGLKLKITDDFHAARYNGKLFLLEGVGRGAVLVEEDEVLGRIERAGWDYVGFADDALVLFVGEIDTTLPAYAADDGASVLLRDASRALQTWMATVEGQATARYSGPYKLLGDAEPTQRDAAIRTASDLALADHMEILAVVTAKPRLAADGSVVVGSSRALATKALRVDGVGVAIQLFDAEVGWDTAEWDGAAGLDLLYTPDYIVVERGSRDQNPWSRANRWFHRDVLTRARREDPLTVRAKRPVIQFRRDLELYNFGDQNVGTVDVRENTLRYADIAGFRANDPDFLRLEYIGGVRRPFDHLKQYGVAPLLLDCDPASKRKVAVATDPTEILESSARLGEEVVVTSAALTAEQIARAVVYTSQPDGSFKPLSRGTDFRVEDRTLRVFQAAMDSPEIRLVYWDTSKGVLIRDGMTILLTGDDNPAYNNHVYRVSGIRETGRVILTRIATGSGDNGEPAVGDLITVRFGRTYGGADCLFDGTTWSTAQIKSGINQEPLFQLYDTDGVRLDDAGRYPESTFQGSPLFTYAVTDSTATPLDTVLYKRVKYRDAGGKAEMVFANHLNRTVAANRYRYAGGDIAGYYFHRTKGRLDLGTTDWFCNDWHRVTGLSKQYITHTFYAKAEQTEAETAYRITIRQKKAPVRTVATAAIALPRTPVPYTGPLVVGGVTLRDGDRVLAVAQPDRAENGLYEIEINADLGVYLFYPSLDANSDDTVNEGTFVEVQEGSHRRTAWVQTAADPILPGVTPTTWRQIAGPRPFARPISVVVDSQELVLGEDYEVVDGVVRFATPLAKNAVVRIRVYADRKPDRPIGVYEVPLNLQANPDWDEVLEISQNEVREHFTGIIAGQRDFAGNAYARNNFRDTEQDLSFGSVIVQHRSPLLKLMLLNSSRDIDLMLACQHGEREYTRYRNKFLRKILEHYETKQSRSVEPSEILDAVLEDLSLGRTFDFPFAHSDMLPGVEQYLVYKQTFAASHGIVSYVLPAATTLTADEADRVLVYLNKYVPEVYDPATNQQVAAHYEGEKLLLAGLDYRMAVDDLGDPQIVFLKNFGFQDQDRITVRFYRDSVTFVPPSPAHLGLRPIYEPMLFTDTSLLTPRRFIVGHDGVFLDAFDGEYAFLNEVVLEFERRVYHATSRTFTATDALPLFDARRYVAGKFRRGSDFDAVPVTRRAAVKAQYDRDEWLDIQRALFERWAVTAGINYRQNQTYTQDNPWSWNYRGIPDRDGEPLPGHWRGVFKHYYDTDRPHVAPWEMLGFSQKPSWWEAHYGAAPYGRANTVLWGDLEQGRIRDGSNAGIRPEFARPGLSAYLPVDEEGTLLDPVAIGLALRRPTPAEGSRPWEFGDHGPAETTWTRHSVYGYAQVQAAYLLKPAHFLELMWDAERVIEIFADDERTRQWVYRDTRDRPAHKDLYIHGETVDGVVRRVTGVQQILADFIIQAGQGVTSTLGEAVRGLGVRLGHKMAGFIDANTMSVRADNIGVLPRENIKLQLYRSPSVAEYTYSGVIIEWTGRRWRVVGYDVVNPFFPIIPHDLNGDRVAVSVGGDPQVPVAPWRPRVFYSVGATVTHEGLTFKATKSHQSEASFEIDNWAETTPEFKQPGVQVVYYKSANRAGRVVKVPYGTEFSTQQEVFDFLIAYGRWQKTQGWAFEDLNPETNETRDWLSSAKDYLFWTLARWAPGSSIALSPVAKLVTFRRDHGEIQGVEQVIQGVYSLLNRDGTMIPPKSTAVSRMGGEITIRPTRSDALLFAARLYVSEVEHVLVFDNTTIFGDLVYDPLLNLRQPRLKLYVARSRDWKGRVDAPGFVVTDNLLATTLFANFEKSTDDIRRYYDIEKAVETPALREHARHLVGFQTRPYLNDLLVVEPAVQFEFYQGLIRDKGTVRSMQALLRSFFVTEAEEVRFMDEWLFRVGSYGGTTNHLALEFRLPAGDLRENPQLIEFRPFADGLGDAVSDTVINLPLLPRDERWVLPPQPDIVPWTRGRQYYLGEKVEWLGHFYLRTRDAEATPDLIAEDLQTLKPANWQEFEPGLEVRRAFPLRPLDQHLDGVAAYQPGRVYGRGDLVKVNGLYFRCSVARERTITAPAGSDAPAAFDAQIARGFWTASKVQPGWLPDAGYARFDEVDHYAASLADLSVYVTDLRTTGTNPARGDLVIVHDCQGDARLFDRSLLPDGPGRVADDLWNPSRGYLPGDWMAYRVSPVGPHPARVVSVEIAEDGRTVLKTDRPHTLRAGDYILLDQPTSEFDSLYGVYEVIEAGAVIADRDGVADEVTMTRLVVRQEVGTEFNADLRTREPVAAVLTEQKFPLRGLDLPGGGTLAAGIRVLVAGQVFDATVGDLRSDNGIYVTSSGDWVRATDFGDDTPSDERVRIAVYVESDGSYWVQNEAAGVDIGFTNVTFAPHTEFGPDLLVLTPARFRHHLTPLTGTRPAGVPAATPDPVAPADGWQAGDLIFCDSGLDATGVPTPGYWSVHRFVGEAIDPVSGTTVAPHWEHVRSEAPKVDASRISEALIYDGAANRILARLTHHDPLKGVVPGVAEREIWYKLEYDPAKYTHGDSSNPDIDPEQAWGATEVGRLWWDVSTVRFLDYEISDNSYRRAAWGRVAPRASVDVYEWVRSPVPPASWAGYVEESLRYTDESFDYRPSGEIRNPDAPSWVETLEYNQTTDLVEATYYFWVKGTTTQPKVPFRSQTAANVARIIADPKAAGIAIFSPVAEDAMIVGGVDASLDDDSVVQVRYRRVDRDDNVHRHWVLMREGEDTNPPDERLWRKLRDSLVGFDGADQQVPDPTLSLHLLYGNEFRPRQAWFRVEADGRPSRMARRIFVAKMNEILAENAVLLERENVEDVLRTSDADSLAQTFKDRRANLVAAAAGYTPRTYTATLANAAGEVQIPLTGYHLGRLDGTPLRVSTADEYDTVLLFDQEATPTGLYRVERATSTADVSFVPLGVTFHEGDIVEVQEGKSRRATRWIAKDTAAGLTFFEIITATEYHREVETLADRDALMADLDIPVEPGEQILVRRHPTAALEWWSLWRFEANRTWTLIAVQRYRTEDFWSQVDWFATGYAASDRPDWVFANEIERDRFAGQTGFGVGDLIEIRLANGGYRRQVALGEGRYRVVAQSGGTIRLSDRLWQSGTAVLRPDAAVTDVFPLAAGRDGTIELGRMFDGLTRLLTASEQNRVFFAMHHFAMTQHADVDWAVKSSLMVIKGINEPLEQRPVLIPDRIEPFLAYVDEVKPYHTKIRDFTVSLTTSDTANLHVTDFDKPVWPLDRTMQNVTIPTTWTGLGQAAEIPYPYTGREFATSTYHRDWWDTYAAIDSSPARHPTTKLFFDRIKWIDWTVDGVDDFLALYGRQFGVNREWDTDRAVLPGHKVLWKNYDGGIMDRWRLYQMVRPNPPQQTLVAEMAAVDGRIQVRTHLPHRLVADDYDAEIAGTDPQYLTIASPVPSWTIEATGWNRSYTLPDGAAVTPGNLLIALGGQYLRDEAPRIDYILEDPDGAGGFRRIRFATKPQAGQSVAIYQPANRLLVGTYKVTRGVDAHTLVIDAPASLLVSPLRLAPDTLGVELYGWRPEILTREDGTQVYFDDLMDPELLTQSERISLYYRPNDGMPAVDNRTLLEAGFRGTQIDAQATDEAAFPTPITRVYGPNVFDIDPAKFVLPWFDPTLPWYSPRRPHPDSVQVAYDDEPVLSEHYTVDLESNVVRFDTFEAMPNVLRDATGAIQRTPEGQAIYRFTLTRNPASNAEVRVWVKPFGLDAVEPATTASVSGRRVEIAGLSGDDVVFVRYPSGTAWVLTLTAPPAEGTTVGITYLGDPVVDATTDGVVRYPRDLDLQGGSFRSPARTGATDTLVEGGMRVPGPVQTFLAPGEGVQEFWLDHAPALGVIAGLNHAAGSPRINGSTTPDVEFRHPDFDWMVRVYVNGRRLDPTAVVVPAYLPDGTPNPAFDPDAYDLVFDPASNRWRLILALAPEPNVTVRIEFVGRATFRNPFVEKERPQELVATGAFDSVTVNVYQLASAGGPMVMSFRYVTERDGHTRFALRGVRPTSLQGVAVTLSHADGSGGVLLDGPMTPDDGTADYAVDFDRAEVVLASPVPTGTEVKITVIGAAGTSLEGTETFTAEAEQRRFRLTANPIHAGGLQVWIRQPDEDVQTELFPTTGFLVVDPDPSTGVIEDPEIVLNGAVPVTDGSEVTVVYHRVNRGDFADQRIVESLLVRKGHDGWPAGPTAVFRMTNPTRVTYSRSSILALADGRPVPVLDLAAGDDGVLVTLDLPLATATSVYLIAFNTPNYSVVDTQEHVYAGTPVALTPAPSPTVPAHAAILVWRKLTAADLAADAARPEADRLGLQAMDEGRYVRLSPPRTTYWAGNGYSTAFEMPHEVVARDQTYVQVQATKYADPVGLQHGRDYVILKSGPAAIHDATTGLPAVTDADIGQVYKLRNIATAAVFKAQWADTAARSCRPADWEWEGDDFITEGGREVYLGDRIAYLGRHPVTGLEQWDIVSGTVDAPDLPGETAGRNVLFRDPPAPGSTLVLVGLDDGDYDYRVENGSLVLAPQTTTGLPLVAGDRLQVMAFTRDDSVGIRTEVFSGVADGRYPLSQKPWSFDSLWVDVNGFRQVYGVDYAIQYTDTGWDWAPWDTEGFDEIDRIPVVLFFTGQRDTDRVVITTMAEQQSQMPLAFTLHYDGHMAEWDYLRISDFHKTRLAAPFLLRDTDLRVDDASRVLPPVYFTGLLGLLTQDRLDAAADFTVVVRTETGPVFFECRAEPNAEGTVGTTEVAAAINTPLSCSDPTKSLMADYGIRAEVGDLGDIRLGGVRKINFDIQDADGRVTQTFFGGGHLEVDEHPAAGGALVWKLRSLILLDEPGIVVMPGGERIAFFAASTDSREPSHRLMRLIRGAVGSAAGTLNRYVAVTVPATGRQTVFDVTLPEAPQKAEGVMVKLLDPDGNTVHEYHRTEYRQAVADARVTITFATAPADGHSVQIAATATNWESQFGPLSEVYPARACVTDGGPGQRIPGGMVWDNPTHPDFTYDGTTLDFAFLRNMDGRKLGVLLVKPDGTQTDLTAGVHYWLERRKLTLMTVDADLDPTTPDGEPVIGRPAAGETWTLRITDTTYHGLQYSQSSMGRFLREHRGTQGCP